MKHSAILFVFALVLGCSPKTEVEAPTAEQEVETIAFKNVEGELQLNDGKKWTANKETTEGVQKMIEQVQGFRGLDVQEDLPSYNLLARGVKNTMDEIFNKCTMKDAAHDELHDFLLPILGMNKKLAGDNLDTAKQGLDDLESHLNSYQDFFE